MKAVRFLVLGLAAAVATACLPVTSKNPIGATAGFKADPALIGLWRGHSDDGDAKDGYLAFLKNEDGSMTALLFQPDDESEGWESFNLQTATLGANRIINAREELKDGKPDDDEMAKEIIPMLYTIGADGKITLALLDDKAASAAVKAGKIEGVVGAGDNGDVRITADSAKLDKFFATPEGARLFSQKLLVLTKVK